VKLVVPYVYELREVDARMVRLAEFLGIPCGTCALEDLTPHPEFLERSLPDGRLCLAVNPRVLQDWTGREHVSTELIDYLVSRFTNLLVYGLSADPFDSELVAALSRGMFKSVEAIEPENSPYVVAEDARDICEAFSGLSFGSANPANDHVLTMGLHHAAVRKLISIGGRPFMATVKSKRAEILFIASNDVVDVNSQVGHAPLIEYFSRFVPQAMALRHVADDECWRPGKPYASVVIDDPLLQKNYGFLNFDSLLRLAERNNFHAAIAFIPHNFRRNSLRTARMFVENPKRLSICFHGNDHTDGEFGTTNPTLINSLLRVAEGRMSSHLESTGLPCDRVMVFPQGKFSVEAMRALKSRNFYAAVNTIPYPVQQVVPLTIGDLAQPAVLKYGDFPLFQRKSIRNIQSQDIAFDLFFGRPVLIVEHHDLFEHPEPLAEIASKINSLAPQILWSNLATLACNSILTRRTPDGTQHIRAYSGTVRLSNDSEFSQLYSIEWVSSRSDSLAEQVLMDGSPYLGIRIYDAGLRISVELPPGSSRTFTSVHRNREIDIRGLGLRWKARAFLRRRLSEIRDNYLSKNRPLLLTAKAFQQRFLKV